MPLSMLIFGAIISIPNFRSQNLKFHNPTNTSIYVLNITFIILRLLSHKGAGGFCKGSLTFLVTLTTYLSDNNCSPIDDLLLQTFSFFSSCWIAATYFRAIDCLRLLKLSLFNTHFTSLPYPLSLSIVGNNKRRM